MKLHLPTRLRAAVLACVTAVAALATTVGTGALTTGAVVYTLAASQANAAYNADTHTFEGSDNANFGTNLPSDPTDIVFNMEDTGTGNWSNGFTYAGNVLIGADGATDKGLCLNNGNAGQTLTLSGAVTGTGLISKKGAGQNNTLALTGDATAFTGNYVLDSTVAFTLRFGSGAAAPATTAEAGVGGTGNITFKTNANSTLTYNYASGSTVHITNTIVRESAATSKVTFGGGANYSVHNDADISQLNINGGIVTFSGSTVLGSVTGDASGILGNGGALTLNGTISLYAAIMNGGSVTLGENVKFDLSHLTAEEGVYTIFDGAAVDLSSLTTANLLGTQAGYDYTFGADGTVTASMLCQNLTWAGGALTWQVGATIGDGTFADGDIVNFTTADADVTLGADLTSAQVNIASGVTVTLSGEHTLTPAEININGTLVMEDATLSSAALNLAGTLELHSGANIASGTVIKNNGNAAKVSVVGTELSANGLLAGYTGTVIVGDGAKIVMGSTSCLGAANNTIVVDAGGVLEVNGQKDHGYTVTLNGGSLVNTGAGVDTGKKQFAGLKLTADSEIGGTSQFGVIGGSYAATSVQLEGHTLTKTGTNTVNMINTAVSAGTLRVEGGTLQLHNASGRTSSMSCDIVLAGGNLLTDACTLNGNHTIKAEGAGGTVSHPDGNGLTVAGSLTVDTAAGSTLTMGRLVTESFTKTGEGTLTMAGALTVNKQLAMNYEGSLTLGDVSVADGAILSYGGASLDSVMSLTAESIVGNVYVDVFALTAEQLAAGVNLGIADGFDTTKLTVGGLDAADYTIAARGENLWLTATKTAEAGWDSNWGTTLVKAPATVTELTITDATYLATQYSEDAVIGVKLTAGGETANNVFGGINNAGVTTAATTTKDVWVEVAEGTFGIIAGGNNCSAWQGASMQNFEGDTHIMLKGGSVGNIIGAHYKDGYGDSFKGSSYISVMEGSNVTGNIIGGIASAHNANTTFTGDSHIFIYTMLSSNSTALDSLGNAWIIGGSSWIANTYGGTQNFNGNTNVTIDLADYAGEAATFAKTIVGGNFSAATNVTTQVLNGDSHVSITGKDSTTFSGWIIAGARSSTVGTNTQNGNAELTIDGGRFTGNVVGAFYQNGASTTAMYGTATTTIKGGTFSNDLRGGAFIGGGTATLGGTVVDIQGGTFSKDIVAGMYNNVSNTHAVTIGDASLTMSDGTVTGSVIGGTRHVTGDGVLKNGNVSVAISGGSVAANVIGGDSIGGTGSASLQAELANISVAVSGGTVKDIYGGSHSARNYAAGAITQGDVTVSLTGGSVTGDVYVGGYQGGSTKLVSASTTLEIGAGATLTDGKVLSGGYKPYSATSAVTSTVTGARTLKLTVAGAQDLSAMTVKDFNVVEVTNAAGNATLATLTQTTGSNAITKTGAGTLTLGAGFTADAMTVSEGSLDITAVTALGGTLTMGAGSTLVTSTADAAMGVTGLTLTEGMTIAITGAAEGYASPIKLLSGLTEATISGLTFEEVEGVKVASIAGIITVSGISSDYSSVSLENGTLSLISTAAPAAELSWLGDSGTWDDSATEWTAEGSSDPVAYTAGANVTIGGEGAPGGTITVSGAQKAKNVTFASDDYVLNAASGASLAISGNLIVNEGVSAAVGFLPTLGESSQIVVNEGSTLDLSAVAISQNLLVTVGSKATGDGTVVLKGNSGTDLRESIELNANVTVDGSLWLNGRDSNATVTVTEGHTLTLTGELSISRTAKVAVEGGTLDAQGGIAVGHPEGNYPTTLSMSSGEIKTTGIKLQSNNTNTIEITGGKLTVTNADAFTGTNDKTTVNISDATLTNGTTDMAFNHGSTLTGATVTAQEGTTITVGGTGLTTNVATGLTTNGTVTMAGTTAVAGAATITDNGTLTIDSLAGAVGSNVTLAGTGATTITGGTADTLTAGKDATVGSLTVKTLTGTGTLTQTAGTTLTVADGGTLSGSVTTGAITAAGSLAKTGTDTVTTGDITGTSTALTVSGGTLSSGAVTVASAEVATGATLTSSGKLTSTGALTLNGAANAASADIAGLILNAGGSLTCTNDLKLGGLTLNSAITSAGVTAASLSSETLDVSVSADVLGALAMGSGDSLTIVGLTTQYGNALTLNGSTDASFDEFGYKYTIASTADGIVITKADAGVVWTGGADDEWGSAGSWQGGGIPTGDDVSASFTGKGDGTVKVSSDGVTIGQIIVTSHDAEAGEKSEYTFTNGDLTIAEDLKVLDGHVIIGTTVAATDVNIIPSAAEGSVSSVTVNGDGALSVSGTLAVEAATEEGIGSLTIQEGGFAGIHSLASSGADVALGGTLAVEEGVIKKLTDESGTKGNLVVGSMVAPTSLTPVVPGKVVILEDSEIDTLQVTNTGELTTKGTLDVATSIDADGKLTSEKNLTTGALTVTSSGEVTVGSAAAPAMLDVTTLANEGTVTVYNTMKAETSVENKSTGTLDIKGELQAADATVENSKTLTVGGALAADTLTTNSGATTEAKGGATIGTELANHGTTTVTGDLASADATAPITITNDATGAGEKLTITGNVTAKSLTTQTDATTELTGTGKTVKLTDKLTNKGTTTIKGALTSADATATTPGSLKIENTGTLATGILTADSLSGNGATTVTGNATMKKLNLGTTGALTASGTVKTDSVSSTGGSVTADTLDLSGLTAAATIADVKADKITLSGFNMLKVTDSISNENGTGAAKVMLTLDAATMSTLSVGDEKVVVATDGSVAGQGITLGNLAAVNSALKAYGIKGAMVTTAAGELVMQMQDNSFVSQIATSENGIAGAEMVDAASAAGLATAGTALGDVYAALDACRTTGDTATGDRIAAAVTGSSIAAMGSALSGDVERQLKAIRNRTTTMGVNQSVINEGMPYVNAWVNAEGDYRKVAADGTMAGYKMMSWGGTVGMDVDVTPSFTCGLAATAMYGDFDADGTDSASGDIDTYYVSAFARYAKHRWTHTFVATAGMADTSLERTVQGHKVKGDSDGMMFGGMYEVGYVFALDKDATTCLQPVLNVSYTHASLSGYDEEGANIGLTAGDTELNKLTVGAGARLQSVIGENIYNRSSILEARALVKFDAGDRQGETDVTFAGSGLPTHTTKSSETGAVGGEFGIGLTVPVGAEGGNIFVDASAEIRAEYTNVNGTVGYRVNF